MPQPSILQEKKKIIGKKAQVTRLVGRNELWITRYRFLGEGELLAIISERTWKRSTCQPDCPVPHRPLLETVHRNQVDDAPLRHPSPRSILGTSSVITQTLWCFGSQHES